jgi:N-acetylglucosaminyldiphosphoundecaprenol N-acetyl-beta-D-mannosaminyltransferase
MRDRAQEERRPPIAILGVPFDNVTTGQTLGIISEMIASGRPHYGVTANVDFVAQALEDVELRRILFDAHLVLCDGMPLVWASRFLGNPLVERVTGSGTIPLLLEEAERQGWRVYFLGGTEQSVAAAAEKTLAKHPRLQLAGAYSPPFQPLLEMDHEGILRRIREAKPEILLVAFGCPKQEKWINMHYRRAGVPFCMGVGATIDFLAGTFKRAPDWMQKSGLEWIYRLLQEPRRLARRYGRDFQIFSKAICRQWWRMRSFPRRKNSSSTAAITAETTAEMSRCLHVKAPIWLGAAEVREWQRDWERAVENGHVLFDLAQTEQADSTGVGALIRLRKLAREQGHAFLLVAPNGRIQAILQLMRLGGFFAVESDLEAAKSRVETEFSRAPIFIRRQASELVLEWTGEVTAANAEELAVRVEAELASVAAGGLVVVDLGQVIFVDSTGAGLMVRLKKRAWQRDICLAFRNPGGAVRNVLRLTRLDEYLLGVKT